MNFDEICGCVIVCTSHHEDERLKRLEERGLSTVEFRRGMFTDGRDLIPDADCQKCHGSGFQL